MIILKFRPRARRTTVPRRQGFHPYTFTEEGSAAMKNPLESLHTTIAMGIALTVLLVILVKAIN